jgi:anti-sigma factor RsiW
MTECTADVKDGLGDVASGRADPALDERVAAHVAGCPECEDELEVLRALVEGRPAMPAALAARIDGGVREGLASEPASRRAGGRIPVWALATAAAVVLALGTPSMMERMGLTSAPDAPSQDVDAVADVWISDGPLVAGAPVLDGLTDEQLTALLDEMGG